MTEIVRVNMEAFIKLAYIIDLDVLTDNVLDAYCRRAHC